MSRLVLTFDAEYPDQSTWSRNDPAVDIDKITSALYQYDIPATFFVQGRWAQANPLPTRKLVEMGYEVGSHGFYHAPTELMTAKGFGADLSKSIGALQSA